MWDLKLNSVEVWVQIISLNIENFKQFLNFLVMYYFNGFSFFNANSQYGFVFNSSIVFGIKFIASIAFLILIRGGTPRYRYDYLTKLGWLKFIGLTLLIFFFSLIFFFVY